jgi:hypothetical protein
MIQYMRVTVPRHWAGVFSNHSDLAPNFAGTLMAITNMMATIPGTCST